MALNAASHNPTGEPTGPVSGPPPPTSDDTKAAISESTSSDPLGQQTGGYDGGDKHAGAKAKTEKELEKERKKAEKLKKFTEKKAKAAEQAAGSTAAGNAPSKKQERKAKQSAPQEKLPRYEEETRPGDKKILKPLDDEYHKAYIPAVVESAWYAWWEKEGFMKPEFASNGKVKKEGYFAIPIPPPNVTGALHMGHALGNALQDVMIRWNRMHGKTTLWLPGCDHAGIATQNVVENMLWRREQKTRHDLGRQKFNERVWEWKGEYHDKINNAQRRMGVSVDWSREAFTMDDNLSAAVTETFVRLHEEGIIYRANRLVNWCTKLNTALSNLEVDNKELEGRTLLDVPGYDRKVEFGVLTYFKYPIEGTNEFLEVATTRPETMLGDTAIAVNPKDERYKHLLGKKAKHPFVDRLMPIVADDYVDAEFGTGAVKITPAHDPNDFAIGTRHKLEFVNILNDDGTLNENAGSDFKGMRRFDARYAVINKLKEAGLYAKWEPNPMRVPICSRSKDVIEPRMKPQWWMRMQEMAKAAAKAVEDKEIEIRPQTSKESYLRWMANFNDWCLSRQLWWGHQVPAYLIHVDGQVSDESDDKCWVTAHTEDEAHKKAERKFPGKTIRLTRDEDVLDTWFSSGLWPFSTLGWPKQTSDLENLYPTSVLETGWDILPFWVARMIMLGIKLTGKIPFREVYCHALIRDSEGRKMSKSLGNVIDPLDVMEGIELQSLHDKLKLGNLDPKELITATKFQKSAFPDGIPECGADALRFCLVNYTTGGGDINFDIKIMHGYRKFCNKIYQATKYVLGKVDSSFTPPRMPTKTGHETLAERWILHKLTTTAREVNKELAEREFSKATSLVYQFWYSQLCDVYIEDSKALIADGSEEQKLSATTTLYTALEGALTMMHPFMPFITEEMWQRLPRRPDDKTRSIMLARYPVYDQNLDDPRSEAAYELVLDAAKAIRSLTAEYNIRDAAKVYIQATDAAAHATFTAELASVRSLAGKAVGDVAVLQPGDPRPEGCMPYSVSAAVTVFLRVKEHVDYDREIAKAQAKTARAGEAVQRQRKLLGDAAFLQKAGEKQLEVERKKLADAEAEVREMEATMNQFQALKLEG